MELYRHRPARPYVWCLYRLLHEPRRLFGRYLAYNTRFLAAFARQYLRERTTARCFNLPSRALIAISQPLTALKKT